MSSLHPVDAIVLVAYLLGITVLGSWMARRITGVADFFHAAPIPEDLT